MAGHSKFANIQHRKGAQDKRRARVFTRLAREIQAAVSVGGAEIANNPRLYRAVAAARAENMPKDNIQRAVDKASGAGAVKLEEMRYEGFGPGGVGVIVECLTDNRNRTAGELRAAFSRNGGNLGETNSVSFGWDKVGEVRYPLAKADEDAMLEAAIEAGADDCEADEEHHIVICATDLLGDLSQALARKFGDASSAKFAWRPRMHTPIEGEGADHLMKLLNALDDLDDVQDVYSNEELSQADLARLGA